MQQPLILAHAFGARYDLPIPLKLFVLGGAAVVVLPFLVAERRTVDTSRVTVATDVTYTRPWTTAGAVWATVSILFLAFLVIVGITGSQEIPENIVPTAFWLVVWIIVPLSCGILGDWTQAVNPFATLAKLCDRPGRRKAVFGSEQPVGWPAKLGWWPAADARRGEYRWLVAMVAYTMLWLWLIAQPLTKEDKPKTTTASLPRLVATDQLLVAAPPGR